MRRFLKDFLKFLYRTFGSIYGRGERLDRGRGRQEFMEADDYQRFRCPGQGVCLSVPSGVQLAPTSPEFVEGEFSQGGLPFYGILRRSPMGGRSLERHKGDVIFLLPALPSEGGQLFHQEAHQRPLLAVVG